MIKSRIVVCLKGSEFANAKEFKDAFERESDYGLEIGRIVSEKSGVLNGDPVLVLDLIIDYKSEYADDPDEVIKGMDGNAEVNYVEDWDDLVDEQMRGTD